MKYGILLEDHEVNKISEIVELLSPNLNARMHTNQLHTYEKDALMKLVDFARQIASDSLK